MSENITDILKQLESLNETSGISVYVPSLKKAIRFKNINLKQQKDLLKSSIDDTLTRLSFTTKFFSIIKENAIDYIDASKLLIIDRLAIAIALRAAGLSPTYGSIDLNNLISQIQATTIDTSSLKTTADIQNLTVNLEAPSLGIDNDISLTTIAKLKNISDRDVKTQIGELFVHEIVKFIQSITFKTEDGEQVVVFANLSTDNKISITEKLPSTVTGKILDFIKAYRTFENKFITFNDTVVEIDSSFFSV
jgi:hypothetical protein